MASLWHEFYADCLAHGAPQIPTSLIAAEIEALRMRVVAFCTETSLSQKILHLAHVQNCPVIFTYILQNDDGAVLIESQLAQNFSLYQIYKTYRCPDPVAVYRYAIYAGNLEFQVLIADFDPDTPLKSVAVVGHYHGQPSSWLTDLLRERRPTGYVNTTYLVETLLMLLKQEHAAWLFKHARCLIAPSCAWGERLWHLVLSTHSPSAAYLQLRVRRPALFDDRVSYRLGPDGYHVDTISAPLTWDPVFSRWLFAQPWRNYITMCTSIAKRARSCPNSRKFLVRFAAVDSIGSVSGRLIAVPDWRPRLIFGLIVMCCDGYADIIQDCLGARFFTIATALPLDLQIHVSELCGKTDRVYLAPRDIHIGQQHASEILEDYSLDGAPPILSM